MSVRERIMTIRLMEKLQAHPACAKALGIEISMVQLSEAANQEE